MSSLDLPVVLLPSGASKRKQHPSRDIHDTQHSPNRDNPPAIAESGDPSPGRAKRRRPASARAFGNTDPAKIESIARSTRSHKDARLLVPESLSTKVGASVKEVGGTGTVTTATKLGRRGRLVRIKAKKPMVPASSNVSGISSTSPVISESHKPDNSVNHKHSIATKTTNAAIQKKSPEISEEGSTQAMDDISSILMGPSPAKVSRTDLKTKDSIQRKIGFKDEIRMRYGNAEKEASVLPSMVNTDEAEEESLDDEVQPRPHVVSLARRGSLPRELDECFDLNTMEKLLETLEKVGYSYKGNKWRRIEKRLSPECEPGKQTVKKLQNLTDTYIQMKALGPPEDIDTLSALDKHHGHATELICDLENKWLSSLKERLAAAQNEDSGSVTTLLRDTYFYILPKYVKVLKLAVELYTSEDRGLTVLALKELTRILKMAVELAEAALNAPKEAQPRPEKSASYHIMKPTKQAMPVLRSLYGRCKDELRARKDDAEKKTSRQWQKRRTQQLAKEKEEREHLAKEDLKRVMTEKARAQRKIIAQKLGCANDQGSSSGFRFSPSQKMSFSQTTLEHMARQKERAEEQVRLLGDRLRVTQYRVNDSAISQRRESASPPVHLTDEEAQGGDDDDSLFNNSVEQDVQRVRLFGQKNKRPNNVERSWSFRDKEIFIEVLRDQCSNPDKYELLSQRLDRSLDEIFDKVKEFKEAMDIAHEKGLFTDIADDWIEAIRIEH
ncbi:hypothetical protein BP6252_06208 [Coleophoma cylindrospora]|uniref:Uncharacterized protein n=1 Tax=Coleophoma cylindrospora TaxID=1849047 RepID=A0A3D8RM98_9HELO|nr:hypothetical protein BP6252_06208 [Coleophoma cylindrospora]